MALLQPALSGLQHAGVLPALGRMLQRGFAAAAADDKITVEVCALGPVSRACFAARFGQRLCRELDVVDLYDLGL